MSAGLHYHILRLDVAVNDSGSVRRVEGIGDLRRNSDGFTPAKLRIRKLIAKRQAFDQFSDDEMKIVCLPGDGIGPEVIEQAVRVAESATARHDRAALTWNRLPWSSAFYKQTGQMMPDASWCCSIAAATVRVMPMP